MSIAVRVAKDGRVTRSFGFDQDLIHVGRDPECDICLPGRAVSRRHLEIRRQDDAYWVFDAGSSNGTRINGAPGTEKALESGDHLSVGEFALWIEILDSSAEPLSGSTDREEPGSEPTIRKRP